MKALRRISRKGYVYYTNVVKYTYHIYVVQHFVYTRMVTGK